MEPADGPDHDTAFRALMGAADAAEFDRRLGVLLVAVDRAIGDAITRTLSSHFRANIAPITEDVADLKGDAVVRLVQRLRELRAEPAPEPIQNFAAYASAVASHICYTYLRRRYPEWTRLKNQVRYIVTHDPDLALEQPDRDTFWCVSRAAASDTGADPDAETLPMRDQVKRLLRRANGKLELNELVSALAALRQIREVVHIGDAESWGAHLPDPRAGGPSDDAWFLKRLWEEVRQLPIRQRLALLLNLRDDRGRGVLALFSLTGTASMRQVAEVLDMPVEALARLWNDLPMDDLRIAERLGVSRQQVINLRKAGRARLARRTAALRVGL
jgi:hypothetical protein